MPISLIDSCQKSKRVIAFHEKAGRSHDRATGKGIMFEIPNEHVLRAKFTEVLPFLSGEEIDRISETLDRMNFEETYQVDDKTYRDLLG